MEGRELDFQEHEDKGRAKYARNATIAYEFMRPKFSNWDVSSTGHGKTFNIEIKDRDIEYTKYPNYWLEKIKYDALVGAYKETGSLPIYLNFFKNNIGFYWNLLKIQPKWVWRLATETTADGTYGQNKVWKLVTFVYTEEGKRFSYE